MAFYELHLNCFLKQNTPLEILETLNFMVSKEKQNIPDYIKKNRINLFNNHSWGIFLTSETEYFPFLGSSSLVYFNHKYLFSVKSSFLAKEELIFDFFNFIEPFISDEDIFLGYYRMPNDNPVLLYFENSKIVYDKPEHSVKNGSHRS